MIRIRKNPHRMPGSSLHVWERIRHALTQYVAHLDHERNHQGKGNVLLFPTVNQDAVRAGPLQCRERLGGLLKYYTCEAA